MAGIVPAMAATGQIVYAQIRDLLTGQVANGSGLEVYNQARWNFYVVAQSEQVGSGFYSAGFPGYLPAGLYLATSYIQLNPSPVAGDTPVYDTVINWDGSNVIGIGSPVDVKKINGSASAAVNLALSANEYAVGAAVAGTLTTTQMTTNLTATVGNIYAGRVMVFTSGVNAGLAVLITAYSVTGGKLTFIAYNNQPAPSAPSATDAFIIL